MAEQLNVKDDAGAQSRLSAGLDALSCPFCGAEGETIDPFGWLGNDGRHGPQCLDCGATAESVEKWNMRV